jgi:hypothetical protein
VEVERQEACSHFDKGTHKLGLCVVGQFGRLLRSASSFSVVVILRGARRAVACGMSHILDERCVPVDPVKEKIIVGPSNFHVYSRGLSSRSEQRERADMEDSGLDCLSNGEGRCGVVARYGMQDFVKFGASGDRKVNLHAP